MHFIFQNYVIYFTLWWLIESIIMKGSPLSWHYISKRAGRLPPSDIYLYYWYCKIRHATLPLPLLPLYPYRYRFYFEAYDILWRRYLRHSPRIMILPKILLGARWFWFYALCIRAPPSSAIYFDNILYQRNNMTFCFPATSQLRNENHRQCADTYHYSEETRLIYRLYQSPAFEFTPF